MIALGVENSNPSASNPLTGGRAATVGLGEVQDGRVVRAIAREVIDVSDPHRDDLMSAVERVLKKADVARRELGLIAVSIGPGGYTAVRIGVTAAKFLAEATGARCVGVPTAWAVVRSGNGVFPVGVALASKGETLWMTVFGGPHEREPGRLMSAQDLRGLGIRSLIADQFLPATFSRAATEQGIEIVAPVFDAIAVIEVGIELPPVDPLVLLPIYPREPEAVTKWRERASVERMGR